ncbi:hypothetical protein MMC07_004018 [Pseudocyphellaria aurata]|nr:hypothetical protein [Pseudocyphellaria aurata]
MAEAELTDPSSHSSSHSPSSSPIPSPEEKKRFVTVYDAVAGRINSRGFIPTFPQSTRERDTVSSSTVPCPPEEVLFRRQGAPARYEEDDIYWADRNLAPGVELPDSDLLKAVHAYAADFYGRTGVTQDFKSLDETALMAIGILLEEWAEVVLGKTGHEVFLEGQRKTADEGRADGTKERDDETDVEVKAEEAREGRRRKKGGRKTADEGRADETKERDDEPDVEVKVEEAREGRRRKKRKTRHSSRGNNTDE